MFRRRITQSIIGRLGGFLWPRAGWRRTGRYLLHRLARLPGTPYSLAAGFAAGAAVSFTPLVGLHFVMGALVAWLIRANLVASAIGTAVGNPWTFPLIWVWLYSIGDWMMRFVGLQDSVETIRPAFAVVFSNMFQAMIMGDWTYLVETAAPVVGPMLFASVPTGLCVGMAVFWLLKPIINRYQSKRRQGHRRARAKIAMKAVRESGI